MNRAACTWQWDDVRFFLAVARAGSLSGAARVLGVGHVTVGRRITLLEKRLGVTLLHRTPDGFAVTAAGDAVLRQCIAMENAALDLERVAAGRDSLAAGSIRLTATEALAHRVIAPAIAELRKSHPDLRVDLAVGVRSLDIARREADLAVRVGRPSGSGLVCRKLGEVGYSLYASSGYVAQHRMPQRGKGPTDRGLVDPCVVPIGRVMIQSVPPMQCPPATPLRPSFSGELPEAMQAASKHQEQIAPSWPMPINDNP